MPVYKTSREEIIRKAFVVFLEKGYYHTSVSDLSKSCGIEKPHFYYYFESKRDLMIAVLRFVRIWARKNMFSYAYDTKLTADQRMRGLLNTLKEIHSKGYAGCIYSNTALETANNDDEFIPVLRDYFSLWRDALENIYRLKYDKSEASDMAIAFFNELNGAILMMKVYKDQTYLNQFVKRKLKEL